MFIGVDLAWGPKARTGLAAVDNEGRLLTLTQLVKDTEIIDWFGAWATGPIVTAIDAPIVVPNLTGNRPCESLVGRYFGRYKAYCHSANRSNPAFAGGTRAQGLADVLGLDIDPDSSAARRAIEVYPHAAIVAVFGLPMILRYKNKPRRDLALLKAETVRLIELLESLATAAIPLDVTTAPEWQRVRQAAITATRKVDLAKIEDSLDAVVCAYVAMLDAGDPDLTRVLGDLRAGYIVTPVTPEIRERIDDDRRVFAARRQRVATTTAVGI